MGLLKGVVNEALGIYDLEELVIDQLAEIYKNVNVSNSNECF